MSIDTDYEVLRDVLSAFNLTGWAVEFGVYSGTSLAIIAEYMPVIGFDSFEGLPEDWREGFPEGAFGDDLPQIMAQAAMCENALVVRGSFADKAVEFPFPPLSLVHIDCDLYSSTVVALEAVRGVLGPGTVIVFDEYHGYDGWEQHEAKAWSEFCERHRVIYRSIATGEQELAVVISSIGV